MYKEMYKNNVNEAVCQELRRRQLLKEQKEKRAMQQDANRPLEGAPMANQVNTSRSDKRVKSNLHYFHDIYNMDFGLQTSEWLRERPENLSDWLLVPCPKGQRCMVIACNGHTDMFNKSGRWQKRVRSNLPGDSNCRNFITILDCIFEKDRKTFYILDALAFGNHNLVECEAEFRFFWIKSKCADLDLSGTDFRSNVRFLCLNQYDFEDSMNVSEVLQKFPIWVNNLPPVDGFLFYHKEANYTCGTTPLVGWLFPFMVPDMLGYAVSSEYDRPQSSITSLQYMELFDAMESSKKNPTNPTPVEPELLDLTGKGDDGTSSEVVLAREGSVEMNFDCNEESDC